MLAATTPVVIQAHSNKSSATQNGSTSTARVSSLTAGNNLTLLATDGNINSQGTQISAEGNALLLAKHDIKLDIAHNYEHKDSNDKTSGVSFDNRKTIPGGNLKNRANGDGSSDTVTGTQLSIGGTTTLATTQGDIRITGSNIASQGDVNINAARKLTIQSAQDTTQNQNHANNKAIGTVYISDTERFAGYHNEKHNDNSAAVTQVSSNVASLGGNVNLKAGETYTQTASNVLAAKDVNVTAKSIELLTADDTGVHHDDDKSLKVGAFARIKSPIIDLINNVEAARKSDGRLAALQGVAAAANAVQAGVGAVGALTQGLAENGKDGLGNGTLAKVEVGIGVASATSKNDNQYQNAQGSTIKGGGNVNLTSTEGDIHAVGAGITAGKTLTLDSADDILLEAGQSTSDAKGKNGNWGVEVGVGASVGAQTGFYVYAQASVGKGKYNSESVTYNNTHLAAGTINLTSKGDTALRGADATANTINADVGGQLTIESLQDTAEQHAKQTSAGARVQVSFGTAWEASGNFAQSKANGSFTGVNQQSGLFAGDGGYHVKADGVDLKGGAIASTNAAKSELTANSLTLSDIENKSEYEASSTGVSLSSNASIGSNVVANLGNVASAVGGSDSDKQSSTTYATLTDGQINIAGQNKTAAETGAHTDLASAHSALTPLPDLKEVLARQEAETTALNTIATAASQALVLAADIKGLGVADAQDSLFAAQESGDQGQVEQAQANLNQAKAEAARWAPSGTYGLAINALVSVTTGLLTDKEPQAIAAALAAPYVAKEIGDRIGQDNALGKAAAHAVLAAAVAALSGANSKESLAAGLATGLTESVIAPAIVNALYGDKKGSELTQEQKETVLALSGVAGGLIGAAVGDSSLATTAAVAGSLNAVENNYLKDHEIIELANGASREDLAEREQERYKVAVANCTPAAGGSVEQCRARLDVLIKDRNELVELYGKEGVSSADRRAIEKSLQNLDSLFTESVARITAGSGGSVNSVIESGKLTDSQEQAYQQLVSRQLGTTLEAVGTGLAAGKATGAVANNRAACFVAGTLVHTSNGVQAIETLHEGDLVLSRSDEHSAVGYKPVLGLKVTADQPIYRLSVANGQGESEYIETTAEHPFWVQGHGWLKAELLESGMILVDEHDQPLTVQSLEKTDQIETVYNIAVEDWHTYFVGKLAVWVHNACFNTNGEARTAAQSLGYRRVSGAQRSSGQEIFYNPKPGPDQPKYITRDIDSHNGGAFKGANSITDLSSKTTRAGTYDANLKPIGK